MEKLLPKRVRVEGSLPGPHKEKLLEIEDTTSAFFNLLQLQKSSPESRLSFCSLNQSESEKYTLNLCVQGSSEEGGVVVHVEFITQYLSMLEESDYHTRKVVVSFAEA